MKKSKFLSLALVAVALFIGQNSVAQDGMMKKRKNGNGRWS